MLKSFKPGDYIVTKDGSRGYVIGYGERVGLFEVRLASGYAVLDTNDIEKDCSATLLESVQ